MERIIWALLFSIFVSAAFSVSAADKLCASQLDGHVSALELVASKPAGISRDTADWAAKELARINHLRSTIGDCAAASQVTEIVQSNEAFLQAELRMREMAVSKSNSTD